MRLGRWCGSCTTTAFDKHKIKFTCTRTVQSILQYATAVATVERKNNAQRERGGAYFAFTVRTRYVDVGFSLFFLFCSGFFFFRFGACVCEFYGTLSVYCIARNISNEIKSRAHYLTLQSLITFAEFCVRMLPLTMMMVLLWLWNAQRGPKRLIYLILLLRCELRAANFVECRTHAVAYSLVCLGSNRRSRFLGISHMPRNKLIHRIRNETENIFAITHLLRTQLNICWLTAGDGGKHSRRRLLYFHLIFFLRCAATICFASPSLCWPLPMSDVLNINVIKSYARIGGLLVCGFWFCCFSLWFNRDRGVIRTLFYLSTEYNGNSRRPISMCDSILYLFCFSRICYTVLLFAFISLFVQIEFLSVRVCFFFFSVIFLSDFSMFHPLLLLYQKAHNFVFFFCSCLLLQ